MYNQRQNESSQSSKKNDSIEQSRQVNSTAKFTNAGWIQRAIADPSQLSPQDVIMMSRLYGNHMVGQIIQRKLPTTSIQRWGEDEVCDPYEAVESGLLKFTEDFNRVFKDILHVFRDGHSIPKKNEAATIGPLYEPSPSLDITVGDIDPFTLEFLFTESQRQKLTHFMQGEPGFIPDRLFNGDSIGRTTVNQRLLMSAHILANGTYMPGSFEQRVHARYCGHWAHIVYHYAGATPASNLAKGVAGNLDHSGNIVLGSWATKYEQPYFAKNEKDLPDVEQPAMENGTGGLGPIPEGTAHASAAEKAAANGKTLGRRRGAPMSEIESIQPGDWIWYYNANGSGNHSVIFAEWEDGSVKTIQLGEGRELKYKSAWVYSQGSPKQGGKRHKAKLGTAFYQIGEYDKVVPVTFISRVSEDANPATTIDELLPPGTKGEARNLAFLEKIARRNRKKGLIVNVEKIMNHLQEENRGHIADIEHRLTPRQKKLLEDANNEEDLERRIMLTQRLRELANNVDVYETNMENTFSDKLDEKHREVTEEINPRINEISMQLQEMDMLEDSLDEQIAAEQLKLDEANIAAKRYGLQMKVKELKRLPEGHPDRDLIPGLKSQIKDYQAEEKKTPKKERRDKVKAIKAEIRKLQKQKPNKWKRGKLEKELKKLGRSSPFGMVHPGNNRGKQLQIKLTGKLEDLMSANQIKKQGFMMEKPADMET